MKPEEELRIFTGMIKQGTPILEIAQKNVVTEPYVRKRAGLPNPFRSDEETRRLKYANVYKLISDEISTLYEPKFITPDHTAKVIESLITMTDSRIILELGMYSGYTTLHMIRAIFGKEGAKVVSIEPRPAHDREFFNRPEIKPWFQWVNGWTPDVLKTLHGQIFDFVFVDSQHDRKTTEAELSALMPITRDGTVIVFHDIARISEDGMFAWLESKVSDNVLKGTIFPTAPQPDVYAAYGADNKSKRPNLGIFIRPW